LGPILDFCWTFEINSPANKPSNGEAFRLFLENWRIVYNLFFTTIFSQKIP